MSVVHWQVGLPFPNLTSPELKERMKYVSDVAVASKMAQGDKAGRERESGSSLSSLLVYPCADFIADGLSSVHEHMHEGSQPVHRYVLSHVCRHSLSSSFTRPDAVPHPPLLRPSDPTRRRLCRPVRLFLSSNPHPHLLTLVLFDYSILVDKRYSQPSIRAKLPKWIGEDVKVCSTFGEGVKSIAGFFKAKREAGMS